MPTIEGRFPIGHGSAASGSSRPQLTAASRRASDSGSGTRSARRRAGQSVTAPGRPASRCPVDPAAPVLHVDVPGVHRSQRAVPKHEPVPGAVDRAATPDRVWTCSSIRVEACTMRDSHTAPVSDWAAITPGVRPVLTTSSDNRQPPQLPRKAPAPLEPSQHQDHAVSAAHQRSGGGSGLSRLRCAAEDRLRRRDAACAVSPLSRTMSVTQ